MATPERWSRSLGDRRGNRVRVYEREPGGMLYVSAWRAGVGESRRSLGHRDRSRAVREAKALLAFVPHDAHEDNARALTLGDLFQQYTTLGKYLPDGLLKTEPYLQHIRAAGANLARHFGPAFPVSSLTPDRIAQYVQKRRGGDITGHEVRTSAIQRELVMLKGALNWACTQFEKGGPLLDRSPLDKVKVPREKDPRRPLLDVAAMDALERIAPEVHPFLRPLIVLARTTGRRLSAILGLRWEDVDFDAGKIRWRAELDKLGRTWVVPVSRRAQAELVRFRATQPGIGSALVFPHPRRRTRGAIPVTRHLAAYWLKRAFALAQVEKPEGSLWHMFRRGWATARKDLPLKDVAAAGGWKDITTLVTCYQQPDDDTLRRVVECPEPRSSSASPSREQTA